MKRPRVLLVEDDELVAAALSRALTRDGDMDIVCAEKLAEALQVVEQEVLDGVIADLGLPGHADGGWAVIAQARAKDAATEAMLITGSGAGSANQAQRLGVRFLAKPIEPRDLRPFYDGVWARIAGIANCASTITAISETADLTVKQRQLLVLVVANKTAAEVAEIAGYALRTYSEHLGPVMRAVARATGFEVKNARDVMIAVYATVYRTAALPERLLGGVVK